MLMSSKLKQNTKITSQKWLSFLTVHILIRSHSCAVCWRQTVWSFTALCEKPSAGTHTKTHTQASHTTEKRLHHAVSPHTLHISQSSHIPTDPTAPAWRGQYRGRGDGPRLNQHTFPAPVTLEGLGTCRYSTWSTPIFHGDATHGWL